MSIQSFILQLFLVISLSVFGQNVGINATGATPDGSAMLDVNSSTSGLLIPRVALVSNTDPILAPTTSLLVWNTSTTGTYSIPGFYYFNGTTWVPFNKRILTNVYSGATVASSIGASALTVTPCSITFTPTSTSVIVSGSITLSLTITGGTFPFSFFCRLRMNAVNQKTANTNFEANTGTAQGNRISLNIQHVITGLTPGTPVTIDLQYGNWFSTGGTVTMTLDPTALGNYANLKIEDL